MKSSEVAILLGVALAAMMFASFALSLFRKVRAARRQLGQNLHERQRLGRICPRCGYDVRSAHRPGGSPLCPECGEPV